MPDAIEYDVRPDMLELIAAKQAVPRTLDPTAMRASWNACGARTGRDYPPGMQGKRPTDAPYAALLRTLDVSDLPPAHIHYAEYDPLADDGPAYAERLRAAGNEVELRCAERMIHGFMRARFSGPDAAAEFDRP